MLGWHFNLGRRPASLPSMAGALLLALALLPACSFSGAVNLSPADAAPSRDASADAGPLVCDSGDGNLLLCMRFEDQSGAGALNDDSRYANDALVVNANFANGNDMQALVTDTTFESQIKESLSLDVMRQITMELWIRPDDLIGSRQLLFDNDAQWRIFLESDNRFACNLRSGGLLVTQPQVIVAGSWQHVACVYDGVTMELYLNGRRVAFMLFDADLRQDGDQGSCIARACPDGGSEYVGQMDNLRIWSVALGRLELCESADVSEDQCPASPPTL